MQRESVSFLITVIFFEIPYDLLFPPALHHYNKVHFRCEMGKLQQSVTEQGWRRGEPPGRINTVNITAEMRMQRHSDVLVAEADLLALISAGWDDEHQSHVCMLNMQLEGNKWCTKHRRRLETEGNMLPGTTDTYEIVARSIRFIKKRWKDML